MSDDAIEPGSVLHWADFEFDDGDTANKFFVIVGAQPNKNYLAVIATSKQKRGRKPQPGGNPEGGWYCIPGGGKDYFEKDTWLLFEKPVELSAAELLMRGSRVGADEGILSGGVVPGIASSGSVCVDEAAPHRLCCGLH
jgi:hypothetical protein